MRKQILCYGDSNTWGFVAGTGMRQPEDVRWTGVCQAALGDGYRIIENGLNGRTTVLDDPYNDYLNGKKSLGYALISQKPLDLVVLMLGSNDLKYVNALRAASGADELVRMILNANSIYRGSQPVFPKNAKVLLIAPPLIAPEINPDSSLAGGVEESKRFSKLYENVAKARGVYYLDSALYTEPSLADCVHITAESHARLGQAIAEKIKEIFSEDAE